MRHYHDIHKCLMFQTSYTFSKKWSLLLIVSIPSNVCNKMFMLWSNSYHWQTVDDGNCQWLILNNCIFGESHLNKILNRFQERSLDAGGLLCFRELDFDRLIAVVVAATKWTNQTTKQIKFHIRQVYCRQTPNKDQSALNSITEIIEFLLFFILINLNTYELYNCSLFTENGAIPIFFALLCFDCQHFMILLKGKAGFVCGMCQDHSCKQLTQRKCKTKIQIFQMEKLTQIKCFPLNLLPL